MLSTALNSRARGKCSHIFVTQRRLEPNCLRTPELSRNAPAGAVAFDVRMAV
jgi:hypothetical protein